MADFLSCNVLGTWYGPNNMLKQEMPTTVLGDVAGTPTMIATPVSDGGVMCVGTTDLAKAARRNWKHASVGGTIMGAVIELAFDIRMHPIDEYVASITSHTFHLGTTTVTTGGDGTGLDFTGGDPHRVLDTYTADPIVVGTCLQSNDGDNSVQNVYYVPTLQMEWHGAARWWDQSVDGGDSVIGGFSMMLTGEIRYEDGYHVANDGVGLDLTTPTWISNWKVYQVAELADWGLNDTPLGGPDLSLYNTYVGAATCYFAFGNEGPTDPIPLAGLHYISSDPPVSEVLITSMEVRFPTVVGSMPAL